MPDQQPNTAFEYWNMATTDWEGYLLNIASDFGGYSNFIEDYGMYMGAPDDYLFHLYNEKMLNTYETLNEKKATNLKKIDIKDRADLRSARESYKNTMKKVDTQLSKLGIKSGVADRVVQDTTKYNVEKTQRTKNKRDIEVRQAEDAYRKDFKKAQITRTKGQSKEVERWFSSAMDDVTRLAQVGAFSDFPNAQDNPMLTFEDMIQNEMFYEAWGACTPPCQPSYSGSGPNVQVTCTCPDSGGGGGGGGGTGGWVPGCNHTITGQCIECPSSSCINSCGSCNAA